MSGNFAIKGGGGGGRTPNGKCHLKFPFWLSAHLPNIIFLDVSIKQWLGNFYKQFRNPHPLFLVPKNLFYDLSYQDILPLD